ncbi:MAG: Der GTPase-activating protein YihI [Glaciecola sp.]|jgi:ribosome assembly protein YihI (activator of Der GTPase)
MAHSKKSRKVGLIGVRKEQKNSWDKKPKKTGPVKAKKTKGKPAGSRHSVALEKNTQGQSVKKDPRIGSKKPIDLRPKPETAVKVRKFATPAAELAALEADNRLHTLLEKLETDVELTKDEQAYVDEKMARHKVLCDLLGIVDDIDDAAEVDAQDDPLAALDAININDFR